MLLHLFFDLTNYVFFELSVESFREVEVCTVCPNGIGVPASLCPSSISIVYKKLDSKEVNRPTLVSIFIHILSFS